MSNIELYTDISLLPASLKKEVKDFVDFLKSKHKGKSKTNERVFGCGKGLFKIHPNFDDPIEDFNDYMAMSF